MLSTQISERYGCFPVSLDVQSVSLFGALDTEQLIQFSYYFAKERWASGQCVFEQGDAPSGIYILISGGIDFIVERDGIGYVEVEHHVGDTFGETAYLGIQPHLGSAVVSRCDNAELLVLSRDAVMQIYEDDINLFSVLMMNLAREVSRKFHRHIQAPVA